MPRRKTRNGKIGSSRLLAVMAPCLSGARPIPSAIPYPVRCAISRAASCRAGAIRRFTPPEPINCAGGVKRGSKEIEPYGPSLSTGSRKGGPGAIFRLAQRRTRTSAAGRGLRDDRRDHLQRSATGRAVKALPHAPSQTPPRAPIETFARYHQGSRIHPRTAQACRGQNRMRPLGGRRRSFVSVHGQCSFSTSANRA